jgi:multidrug efflux system outer membrane protein
MNKAAQLLILFSGLFSACMVGPNYKKPETPMPKNFIEEDKAKTAALTDAELVNWWKIFNDPLLDHLLEVTKHSNFDLRFALQQVLEARAQYRIQASNLWPEIDLEASAIRSRFSQNLFDSTFLGPPVQNFFQVGFDTVWELDFFGRIRRAKRAAYFNWEATKENVQAVQITVLSEVARIYTAIRALQNRLEIAHMRVELDQELLALSGVRSKAGLADEQTVQRSLSFLEQDKVTVSTLEILLKQTIYSLSTLLGKQPEEFASLFQESRPIPHAEGKVPIALPSELLRRRPDIRSAERMLASATEQIGVAVASLFPQITLTGSGYGFQSNRTSNLFSSGSQFWNIGPNVFWPVIDFGKRRAQVDVENALQEQALISYERTVVSALEEVESALVAYFKEEERMRDLKSQVEASRNTWILNKDLYEAGLADYSLVLDSRDILLSSENALLQSKQALTSDLIAIYKALGGNWECCSTP